MRIVHRQWTVIITRDDENRAERNKNRKKNRSSEIRGFGWEQKSVAGTWVAPSLRTHVGQIVIEGGSEIERLNAN